MDTIRHEYAHAWYYIDPVSLGRTGSYTHLVHPTAMHHQIPIAPGGKSLKRDPDYQKGKARRKTDNARLNYYYTHLLQNFITDYATTNASEDFAETFMFFLKYRRSLERFANRPVVYHKLRMVERAVAVAARRAKQFTDRSYRRRTA